MRAPPDLSYKLQFASRHAFIFVHWCCVVLFGHLGSHCGAASVFLQSACGIEVNDCAKWRNSCYKVCLLLLIPFLGSLSQLTPSPIGFRRECGSVHNTARRMESPLGSRWKRWKLWHLFSRSPLFSTSSDEGGGEVDGSACSLSEGCPMGRARPAHSSCQVINHLDCLE